MSGTASRAEAAVCLVVFAAGCVAADRLLGVTWGMARRLADEARWRRFQRACHRSEKRRIAQARALHPSSETSGR